MAIHDWGRNLRLESADAIQRAEALARAYPNKYEHTNIAPGGRKAATACWFYFIATECEVDQVANWVTCGMGEKPNGVRTV